MGGVVKGMDKVLASMDMSKIASALSVGPRDCLAGSVAAVTVCSVKGPAVAGAAQMSTDSPLFSHEWWLIST